MEHAFAACLCASKGIDVSTGEKHSHGQATPRPVVGYVSILDPYRRVGKTDMHNYSKNRGAGRLFPHRISCLESMQKKQTRVLEYDSNEGAKTLACLPRLME